MNLVTAYDLRERDRGCPKIIVAIKKLEDAHKVQYSLSCVYTHHSAQEAYKLLSTAVDSNDKLAIIEAASVGRLASCSKILERDSR